MASGIAVPDECYTLYQDFKIGHKYEYVMFRISDDCTQIQAEHKVEEKLSKEKKKTITEEDARRRFKEFIDKCVETDQPKYCIIDVPYWINEPNGSKRPSSKIALLNWCPDTLNVKKKMMFASSKDALKKKFKDGYTEVNCSDISDLDYDEVVKALL